jgi:hypothetical protein
LPRAAGASAITPLRAASSCSVTATHPGYQGKGPTRETIARLHREHIARQVAIHDKLQEVHQGLGSLGTQRK